MQLCRRLFADRSRSTPILRNIQTLNSGVDRQTIGNCRRGIAALRRAHWPKSGTDFRNNGAVTGISRDSMSRTEVPQLVAAPCRHLASHARTHTSGLRSLGEAGRRWDERSLAGSPCRAGDARRHQDAERQFGGAFRPISAIAQRGADDGAHHLEQRRARARYRR